MVHCQPEEFSLIFTGLTFELHFPESMLFLGIYGES